MLRKYNEDLSEVNFYYSPVDEQKMYSVNIEGEVFEISPYLEKNKTKTKLKPIVKDGVKYHVIDGKEYKLANIVNYAFKGKMGSAMDDYLTMDITFLDGNPDNIHPSNMVWEFGSGKDDEDGFRIIPGFARYKVNREGIVKRADTGFIYSPVADVTGHLYVRLSMDIGKGKGQDTRSLGVHRVVAMAFIPKPPSDKQLDVGHIDNNPANNRVENLEWVTRRQNNTHAVNCKRNPLAREVLVRDVKTGEVVEFVSRRECAAFFNTHITKITNKCKSKGQKIFSDYRQFCLKEEFEGWCEGNSPTTYNPFSIGGYRYGGSLVTPKRFVPVRVEIKNESTGEVMRTMFPSDFEKFVVFKEGFSYKVEK